jgi:hypothetical protein
MIGGERIHKSRSEIADYVARTYFQDEGTFDDFIAYYDMILEDLGLSSDPKLALNGRTYENKFNKSETVLWKHGHSFRYYDTASYDFSEFWQELAFTQYRDVEYSALKFFRDHAELMRRYDIRDEYELHNLLRKLCQKSDAPNISICRMPILEFGKANRDGQVWDMMTRLAPVTIQDLAEAYEEEYGVLTSTFMANFTRSFDEYFHDGICDISLPPLSTEQFTAMSDALAEDYYELTDVKRIYQREFPGEQDANINPYVLKTLGFIIFTDYVIRNTYQSATEYFRALLTKDDLVDARDFPLGVTGKQSYTSELAMLKERYEIVEYEPLRYINIRRLNSVGVNSGQLKAYCNDVARYVDAGAYFTITFLNKSGFCHVLDDLGFGEVFYSSLLSVDKRFNYQRVGGVKVFRRGTKDVSLRGFIEYIVEREFAIDIYALTGWLADQYGVNIEQHKIVETVKNSSMYYDAIMEKVYIDYNTYFEEV